MARPRVPLEKALASGAAQHDPQRFRNRKAPKAKPLGAPYVVMSEGEKAAWLDMAGDMPWLRSGHRVLLRLASQIVARMDEGEQLPISAINSLSVILSKLGATPVDETKVNHAGDGDEDPDDRFFGGKTN